MKATLHQSDRLDRQMEAVTQLARRPRSKRLPRCEGEGASRRSAACDAWGGFALHVTVNSPRASQVRGSRRFGATLPCIRRRTRPSRCEDAPARGVSRTSAFPPPSPAEVSACIAAGGRVMQQPPAELKSSRTSAKAGSKLSGVPTSRLEAQSPRTTRASRTLASLLLASRRKRPRPSRRACSATGRTPRPRYPG
jgi:hypothetical protein